MATLAALLDDEGAIPDVARGVFQLPLDTLAALDARLANLDKEIARRARDDEIARRLMTIPGIGPITVTAITALAPPAETFTKGRDFAAGLGITPRQKSSGGKQKLGATSKMGERTLSRLLIIGNSALVLHASKRGAPKGSWLEQMMARKPRMPNRKRIRPSIHGSTASRHLVERFFNKLKHLRAIVTRFEKNSEKNYVALVKLASVRIWLRAYQSTPKGKSFRHSDAVRMHCLIPPDTW